jgi:hypothetical protein
MVRNFGRAKVSQFEHRFSEVYLEERRGMCEDWCGSVLPSVPVVYPFLATPSQFFVIKDMLSDVSLFAQA